ncbi:hypothetical protein [Rhodococcus opacus]|uniref:hypothetical protein n=1 Tax=Rhodococcus opacus TaxID=37919 RepID=UPI002475D932|nr:hypothetical protein [Rhodococcus opacus]
MAALRAVPFRLLEEPLRFELVYALQQRDTDARASLDPVNLRQMYQALRRGGLSTLIGSDPLEVAELTTCTRHVRVLAVDCVRRVEAEHRAWSGHDDRNPRLIYLAELDFTNHHPPGPNALADLSGFTQGWVVESLAHWMRHTRNNTTTITRMVGAWRLADQVLGAHDKPPARLGSTDIDAVVRAITAKWPSAGEQRRRMTMLWKLIEYGHRADELDHIWSAISHASAETGRRTSRLLESAPDATTTSPFGSCPSLSWTGSWITSTSSSATPTTAPWRPGRCCLCSNAAGAGPWRSCGFGTTACPTTRPAIPFSSGNG